jgi:hypothetical protein
MAKYESVKHAILHSLTREVDLTFAELIAHVSTLLDGFEGSIPWYVTTVKLDLEARDLIERVPGSKPQRLRMIENVSGRLR